MGVPRETVQWTLNGRTREELRASVLQKWAAEKCGSASEFQRYRYDVEDYAGGGKVFLHRPAFKNKGCDFVVNCDPPIPRDDGRRFKNPRHEDLIRELELIARAIANGRQFVSDAVQAVWCCADVDSVTKTLVSGIDDEHWAMRAERALKVAKWLFIEQDITDWNTSGRAMLMAGINKGLDEVP